LKDDYGSELREDYTITEWKDENRDHSYASDRIPSDVTVPSDAVVKSKDDNGVAFRRRILNPDYDSSKEYVQREERDEWNLIGLLGQIPITKGQPVASTWIKMKEVSDTVEMWFVK